jgi:hypothetical protein
MTHLSICFVDVADDSLRPHGGHDEGSPIVTLFLLVSTVRSEKYTPLVSVNVGMAAELMGSEYDASGNAGMRLRGCNSTNSHPRISNFASF